VQEEHVFEEVLRMLPGGGAMQFDLRLCELPQYK
jgi:hypothetical protein